MEERRGGHRLMTAFASANRRARKKMRHPRSLHETLSNGAARRFTCTPCRRRRRRSLRRRSCMEGTSWPRYRASLRFILNEMPSARLTPAGGRMCSCDAVARHPPAALALAMLGYFCISFHFRAYFTRVFDELVDGT